MGCQWLAKHKPIILLFTSVYILSDINKYFGMIVESLLFSVLEIYEFKMLSTRWHDMLN